MPILGVCDTVAYNVKKKTTFHIKSVFDSAFKLKVPALIVPHITSVSDTQMSNHTQWSHLQNLELADPEWMNGGRIDLLLGAAVHSEIILNGLIKGMPGEPIAQKTELGWIVSGGDGGQEIMSAKAFTLKVTNAVRKLMV